MKIGQRNLFRVFLRWQDDRLSKREERRLQKWLSKSSENQRIWKRLQQVWEIAASLPEPPVSEKEQQWQRLRIKLAATQSQPLPLLARFRNSFSDRRKWWRISVPRLAIAGATLILLLVLLPLLKMEKFQTVNVPFGQRLQLTLADGSQIHLNAGSTLKYPENFKDNVRRVILKGEAFFKVTRSPKIFVVETGQAKIQVLGTEFNVNSRDMVTEVYVKTGLVRVEPKNGAGMLLKSGEMVTCHQGEMTLKKVDRPEEILAWLKGKLVFHRRPFKEVLQEIERLYNVHLEADHVLLDNTITATFSSETLPEIIKALAATLNAKYVKTNRGYKFIKER